LNKINKNKIRAKNFTPFIKTKLKDLNPDTQELALDLTDFFMDEGKMPLFTQVSSKDFLGTLVNILKTRGAPGTQEKILYLLKKWGIKFEKNKDIIPTFTDLYDQLKRNNTVFPTITNPPYRKYVYSSNEENYNNSGQKVSSGNSDKKPEKNLHKKSSSNIPEDLNAKKEKTSNYDYKNYIDLNSNKFNKKYKKFVDELVVWMDNITLANVK